MFLRAAGPFFGESNGQRTNSVVSLHSLNALTHKLHGSASRTVVPRIHPNADAYGKSTRDKATSWLWWQ